MKISSLKQFVTAVLNLEEKNEPGDFLLYRGVSNAKYAQVPSIGRKDKKSKKVGL